VNTLNRLMHWLQSGGAGEEPASARAAATSFDLEVARSAMVQAVEPCCESHRMRARCKLAGARSAIDLWFLRNELYLYLAQDLGQNEANRRMALLVPLFQGVVPEASGHR
jgi:hypothetical protein